MDWITENIAIGNFIDAKNATENDVDAILCLIDDCCREDDERYDVLNIPLLDASGNDKSVFDDAVDFIHDVVKHNERILVHCHAGRSRSVCIVARYFMKMKNLTSNEALKLIEGKREIYLSPGIEEILDIKP